MSRLEDLTPTTSIRGILPDGLVTVVSVQWFGSEALELTYKTPTGKVANELLYRHDEPRLEVVEQGRPWSFDGDGHLFRLVSEANRIQLAHLFDPVLAVHTSVVDPLPHQITAVYEAMLPRQPLRFLLADDPGAGKTIMAGLLMKELIARGDLQRCLVVLEQARAEIWQSWRATCAENADDPRAKELFDRHTLPAFHDPFAGGGAMPLEAQRLGLDAYASDLNPVAVLINKAMIEIPPRFAGKPPVNPDSRSDKSLVEGAWRGAQGLAEDVRYYGQWMRDEAEKRIGHLYPAAEVTSELAKERPDLKPYVGKKLTVIAWLWARTVKSPNPAFAQIDVPLASTFVLCTKKGKEAYVEPVVEGDLYRFKVKMGKAKDIEATKRGTKLPRANFVCRSPISAEYIKAEGLGPPNGNAASGDRCGGRREPGLPATNTRNGGHRQKGESGMDARRHNREGCPSVYADPVWVDQMERPLH